MNEKMITVDTVPIELPSLVRTLSSDTDPEVCRPWNLFTILILLSAFLLFQTELILAKYILPWFGGTPAVWNTCMLFYQSVLLAGYGYSHWLSSHFRSEKQARIHFGLVATALAALAITVLCWGSPLTPAAHWKYAFANTPVVHIFVLLMLAAGIPFFLLSTTGPLMQHWFSQLYPGRSPFRLYAISNLGSLFGLLSYPFLLEWLLPVRRQGFLWTLLFAIFLLLCGVQTWAIRKYRFAKEANEEPERFSPHRPHQFEFALWIALSACASVMLLATTNLICQNISSVPFLWVVPLCLYLLSFVICFENSRWYRRIVFYPLYFFSVLLVIWMMTSEQSGLDVLAQLTRYFLVLFVVCMLCNGELERLKPSARHLTSFYLSIACGGALGGVLVVLVAPYLFRGFYEFHIAVFATGLLILAMVALGERFSPQIRPGLRHRSETIARVLSALGASAVLVLLASGAYVSAHRQTRNITQLRNFFGVKRVYEKDGIRFLQNGAVAHGGQMVAEARRMEPIIYYTPHTGVGLLLENYRRLTGRKESDHLRIGVIGLGTGTLAAYARSGDSMRFYEIDPQVVQLSYGARPTFTYLHDSQGIIETILGDARIRLETEAAKHEFQRFDILVVDAFGGDAIPIHLLTSEAMQLYLQHLNGPDSVIAVHISNRVVDLTPVLRALSSKWQLNFDMVGTFDVDWVLLSRNKDILDSPVLRQPFDWSKDSPVLWTDDYSNLLTVLKR